MPITLVGSTGSSGTAIDITQVSNWITGLNNIPTLTDDFILVVAATVGAAIPNITTAGYTDPFGTITQNSRLIVRHFWKFKDPGETTIAVPNIYNVTNGGTWIAYVFRGVNRSVPFDITPSLAAHVTKNGGTSNANPPAITPVTPGTVVIGLVHDWSASGTSNVRWAAPATNYLTFSIYDGTAGDSDHCYQALGFHPPWTSGAVDADILGEYADSWICSVFALRDAAASAGGRINVWNGTAWVKEPAKVWNGTAWVEKPVKFWNGTTWRTTT
jgi:hypothetical protein